MAVVTEYLFQLIAKHVDDHGLVVWYDPNRAYGAVVADLSLPKTIVARPAGIFSMARLVSERTAVRRHPQPGLCKAIIGIVADDEEYLEDVADSNP